MLVLVANYCCFVNKNRHSGNKSGIHTYACVAISNFKHSIAQYYFTGSATQVKTPKFSRRRPYRPHWTESLLFNTPYY